MPLWLQVAGAVASALLSFFTKYDDTQIKDLLKDIAYNVGLALERLEEISYKMDELLKALSDLPDIERRLLYNQRISDLNNIIKASLIEYRQLINSKGDDSFVTKQITHIYENVVDARTQLESFSVDGELQSAPLTASLCPIALLLELALLYRLGSATKSVRRATCQEYISWTTRLLDTTVKNSVASAAQIAKAQLQKSEMLVANGAFATAVAHPGSRQAVYGIEHQFGSTVLIPWAGNAPYAELQGSTWTRLYAVITLHLIDDSRETLWVINDQEPKLEPPEVYSRRAYTDIWYGRKPAWTIGLKTYDSGDVQRFEGETGVQRQADIENHPWWRDFIIKAAPAAIKDLKDNNEARVFVRYSNDTVLAIKAALSVASNVLNGKIHSSIHPQDNLTFMANPEAS